MNKPNKPAAWFALVRPGLSRPEGVPDSPRSRIKD